MVGIVIMGASSGIGLRVAEELASRGIRVGMAARHTTNMRKLKEKYPDFVEYASIDITHANAPSQLGALIQKLGGMDIYFHVAGIGYENLSLDPQREENIIATNAGGFARMVSTAYRFFRDNKLPGRIVAVTSVAGTKGIGRLSAYSASKKCAQTYLTALEQLAYAEKADIKFTDIRPGWVRTPLLVESERYPMEMTLDYVVPQIIKAIVRHPRVAIVDWRWSLLAKLWDKLPNKLWVRMDIPVSKPGRPLPLPSDTPIPEAKEEEKIAREI